MKRRMDYRDVVLTAIALLLGLNLLVGSPAAPSPELTASASAQVSSYSRDSAPERAPRAADASPSTPFDGATQRKQIIDELRSMSKRVASVESTLKGGLNVRVESMPEIKFPEPK